MEGRSERRRWERERQIARTMQRWAWAISLVATTLTTGFIYAWARDGRVLIAGALTLLLVFLTVRYTARWIERQADDWIRKRWGQ